MLNQRSSLLHIDFCASLAAPSESRGPEEVSDNLEVHGCLHFVTLQTTFFISATSVAMERRNSKAVLYVLTRREMLIAVDKCLRSLYFCVLRLLHLELSSVYFHLR